MDKFLKNLARLNLALARKGFPHLNPLIMTRGYAVDATSSPALEVDIKEHNGVTWFYLRHEGRTVAVWFFKDYKTEQPAAQV